MEAYMRSTARMLAGYKAGRTRKLNQLHQKAMSKLREIAISEGWMLPSILRVDGGVELGYEYGSGRRFIKFSNYGEALDYVLSIFCC